MLHSFMIMMMITKANDIYNFDNDDAGEAGDAGDAGDAEYGADDDNDDDDDDILCAYCMLIEDKVKASCLHFPHRLQGGTMMRMMMMGMMAMMVRMMKVVMVVHLWMGFL